MKNKNCFSMINVFTTLSWHHKLGRENPKNLQGYTPKVPPGIVTMFHCLQWTPLLNMKRSTSVYPKFLSCKSYIMGRIYY